MKFEYIEVKTEQNIFLNGFHTTGGNKSCAIFIPGVSGNFMENKFARVIGDVCIENNIDFLFAHNQGSFQIANPPCIKGNGNLSSIMRGAAYEFFNDCIYDLDAWMKFVSNYENLYIVAHSLGCNKTLHYLQKTTPTNLKKIVLLAPEDLETFRDIPEHKGLFEEATSNIEAGQPNKLLSKKFLGYCVMSSHTFYDFITNPKINNIPYKTPNGDMSALEKITCPLFAVIGAEEDAKATEYMHKIANTVSDGKSMVIPDANHIFKNQEQTLANKVIEFLTHHR